MGNTQHRHRRLQEEEEEELLQVVVVQEEDDEISTFYCKICMNFISSVMKFKNNKNCGHLFCRDCMAKYIQTKVEDGWAHIKCPWWGCTHFLDPIACRPVLSVSCFDQWCDLLCDSYVLGFQRCYCSYSDSSAPVVNECGGNVDKVNCPNRKFQWNVHSLTDGLGEDRDNFFGKLMDQKKWAICPQCKHCVELFQDCRIVTCRCRTLFCYRCGIKCDIVGDSRCWRIGQSIIISNLTTVVMMVFICLAYIFTRQLARL